MKYRTIKTILNQFLCSISILIVLFYVSSTQALEATAPTTADGHQLKPSDPLLALNSTFRKAYAGLRNDILAKSSPIIIQIGDKMVLLKNGTRTESKALSYRFHELKALSHIPLALYVMLVNGTDSKLDEAGLIKIREYRGLLVQARTSVYGRDFRAEQRERQFRIIDRSLNIIDTALLTRSVSKDALQEFTHSQRDDILANSYEAAEDQIFSMQKQFESWLAEMKPEERKRLRVVVGASHMPRVGSLAMQYFSVALGEPYEGRYEVEDDKNSDFRLIYGENMFEEEGALRLLGTHLLDSGAGVYFFNDAQRMHRDLLADAAEEIIRKKLGKTPVSSQ